MNCTSVLCRSTSMGWTASSLSRNFSFARLPFTGLPSLPDEGTTLAGAYAGVTGAELTCPCSLDEFAKYLLSSNVGGWGSSGVVFISPGRLYRDPGTEADCFIPWLWAERCTPGLPAETLDGYPLLAAEVAVSFRAIMSPGICPSSGI